MKIEIVEFPVSYTHLADAAKDHEGVVVADTLDELAQKTGIDAEALKATVDRWNSFAAKMEDEDYGRTAQFWFPISTGPYYALKTTFFSSVCHGGITKNQNAQVTRIDGSVIDGLYAAGEVTTVTNSNGYTISNAMTFGTVSYTHLYVYKRQQCSFTMVNVTDGADIDMLFRSVKFCFCHFANSS